ncbi:hypothetical protein [Salinispora arenicola]|uniref:hypothetical protein n=1 Tax=Salinispora arenicola TaxID=168697 RepID=UPI00042011F7|nr:hypothetical protein [Salinispora arenicola]MCN0181135.1 hypothetical protein [Salinispora arenicola]
MKEVLGRLRHPNTRTTGARRAHINAPRCDPAGSGAAWAALPLASAIYDEHTVTLATLH